MRERKRPIGSINVQSLQHHDESGRSVTRLIAAGNGRSTIRSPCPMAASSLPRRRRRSHHEATEGLHANRTQAKSEAQRMLEEYLEPDRTITSASLTGWLGC